MDTFHSSWTLNRRNKLITHLNSWQIPNPYIDFSARKVPQPLMQNDPMRRELTAGPLVLHSYVPLVLAGVLVELTLVAVVLPIAAAHRLLRFALAAEGAHAFRRQAIWRLDTGAAVAAGHLGAGVLQSCRWGQTWKQGLVTSKSGVLTLKNTAVGTLAATGHRGASRVTGRLIQVAAGALFGRSAQLFWVWRTTWHPWVGTRCHGCRLAQTGCVSFRGAAWIDSGALHSQHILRRYAPACFNRHSWKATLWIFTFLQMRPGVEEGRREEGERCPAQRTLFPPQLNSVPLVAEWLSVPTGRGRNF